MSVRRAFKSKNKNKRKPFDISLEGEVFTCRGGVSGGLLLRFVEKFSDMGIADSEEGVDEDNVDISSLAKMNETIREFFTLAIIRQDQDRFFSFIDDPDNEIEMELLIDMMSWLMEVYSSRPLDTSEESTKNT